MNRIILNVHNGHWGFLRVVFIFEKSQSDSEPSLVKQVNDQFVFLVTFYQPRVEFLQTPFSMIESSLCVMGQGL